MKKVDLHIHTNHSQDADYKPAKIVEKAINKDLAAIAITDHNVTSGIPEALDFAQDKEIEIIPGIEFDTNYGDNILHILGYYLDWQSEKIKNLVAGMKESKREQFYERIRRLQQLGYDITAEEVIAKVEAEIPLGARIAQVLLAKPVNQAKESLQPYLNGDKSDQPYFNFYLDFFKAGAKVDVPCWKPSAKETIELIVELGGVAVLAHPGSTLTADDGVVIDDLISAGLKGMEVYSTYHDSDEIEAFRELAREKDLLMTAGSDFHGHLKPEIEIGEVGGNEYEIVEGLKELSSSNFN